MIFAVKETPGAEREHDVPAKLQSLDKSEVQHLYPGSFNKPVRARTSGRQEPREGEEEAGNRRQPPGQGIRESASFRRCHVLVSRRLDSSFSVCNSRCFDSLNMAILIQMNGPYGANRYAGVHPD
jgi:hypothetical protein